jgi:hypothetical protein
VERTFDRYQLTTRSALSLLVTCTIATLIAILLPPVVSTLPR